MRSALLAASLMLGLAPLAFAQQNPPPSPVFANIKVELTISDTYAEAPSSKTVMLLVMAGDRGMVRTSNRLSNGQGVELNVDVHTLLLTNGAIRLGLTFEYTPAQSAAPESRTLPAQLNESLTVVLQDGKKLMVSQSADPATDRKVTVEVTATVIK